MSDKPLFIPLKAEHFNAFEDGSKTEEFRLYGHRWNERTCRINRRVVLSYGYGPARRLHGAVVSFGCTNRLNADFLACYPNASKSGIMACIGIQLDTQL